MHLYTYQTTDGPRACNGFSFSFRANSREEADEIAQQKAAAMFAKAEFLKVI
jgi:hypothetical protein